MVDFGYTELFPTTANRVTKTFQVVNEGAGTLELDEAIVVPLGFTLAQPFGDVMLQPGEWTTFQVTVDAAAPGPGSTWAATAGHTGRRAIRPRMRAVVTTTMRLPEGRRA